MAPILPNLLDPEPPPRRSRLRALSGLALLAAMAGGIWAFGYWEPRLLPVQMIEVQGELHHHSSQQLRDTLAQRLSGGFLTADLQDLKQAAQDLPWVGGASIRRVWPDRLQVRVLEHKPVARWQGDGLVTAEGVVFHPRTGSVPAGLPMLEGDEQRARELVQRYLEWRDQLMLAGQLIDTVGVDARGAWHVGLVSKARLELGTNDIETRLARFISAAPQLDAAGRAEVVDLRYSNGFAVKWAGNSGVADAAETAAPTTAKSADQDLGRDPRQGIGEGSGEAPDQPGRRSKVADRRPAQDINPGQGHAAGADAGPDAVTRPRTAVGTGADPGRSGAPGAKPQERTGKRG